MPGFIPFGQPRHRHGGPLPGGGISMSWFVRSFQHSNRRHILDRIEKIRAAAGESTEARLCIGAPSEFEIGGSLSVTVNWPEDHNEQDEGITRERYKEIQAVVREIRVTNPDDDDVWVDLLARNSSLLQRDNGTEFWIDWLQDLATMPRAE